MSILEEALRRKAAETGPHPPTPHPPNPPRQPPPLPPPPKRRRRWPIGLLILLLVAIGGAILLTRLPWSAHRFDLSRLWRSAEAPSTDPESSRTIPGTVLRHARAVLAKVTANREEPTEEPSSTAAGATDATEPMKPEESTPTAEETKSERPAPPRTAVPPPPPTPVRWPKLTLQGTLATRSPATSQAIINGRLLRIGDQIEGASLIAIEEGVVTFEMQGQRRELRVGVAWE